MSRPELIALVERIINADASSEAELSSLIALFKSNVPDPAATDLIYWPERHALAGGRRDLTAIEVVELAFHYKPIITPPPEKPA